MTIHTEERDYAVGFLDGFVRGKLRMPDAAYKEGYKEGNTQIRVIEKGVADLNVYKKAVEVLQATVKESAG